MKFIIIFTLLVQFLYSDEMKRIDSILKDITELRQKYDECQEKLKHDDKIQTYQKIVRNYKILIKIKDAKIVSLENRVKKLSTKHSKVSRSASHYKKCKLQGSPFPKLLLKESKGVVSREIITFKASTFRLKNDADIYDGVDKNRITTWEKKRSFTSNIKTQNWVKITGYFVDKKWMKSKKEMWIKSSDIFKRE